MMITPRKVITELRVDLPRDGTATRDLIHVKDSLHSKDLNLPQNELEKNLDFPVLKTLFFGKLVT